MKLAHQNRENVSKITIGMPEKDMLDMMGNPQLTRWGVFKGSQITIYEYMTSNCTRSDCYSLIRVTDGAVSQIDCLKPRRTDYYSPIPEDIRRSIHKVAIVIPKLPTELKPSRWDKHIEYHPEQVAAGIIIMLIAGAPAGGSAKTIHYRIVKDQESIPAEAIPNLNLSETIAEYIADAGVKLTNTEFEIYSDEVLNTQTEITGYCNLRDRGNDLAIELNNMKWMLLRKKDDSLLGKLVIMMNIKVVDLKVLAEFYSYDTVFNSNIYPYSEWLDPENKILKEETERLCRSLSEKTVEHLFLVNDFFVSAPFVVKPWHVIKPIYPPLKSKYSRVSSLRPRLSWESFPGEYDRKYDKGNLLNHVTDVRYDLRIWLAHNYYPERLIYSKENIPYNFHTIEFELEPSTKYLWTVRSRFKLDSQERLTRWACLKHYSYPNFHSYNNFPRFYYRFETP
jgi:hypothetical protein